MGCLCAGSAWSLRIEVIPSSQLLDEVIWFGGFSIKGVLWALLCPEPCYVLGFLKQVCVTLPTL